MLFRQILITESYIPHPAAGGNLLLNQTKHTKPAHSVWPMRRIRALLITIRDAPTIEIVDGKLDGDFVSREDLDVMESHLP